MDIELNIFFENSIIVDGLEVWEPYINEFKLFEKYRSTIHVDARNWNNYCYDMVIFGDVLEHMTEIEAKSLWIKVSKMAKHAIITIPIIHYPQGAEFGNPYEVHHEEDWNTERVLNSFPGIIEYKEFSITGAYLAKFTI